MINLRPVEARDHNLEQYDHTVLQAVATCPRWGVIRYGKSLTFTSSARAMALEAGRALHETFAAIRCIELLLGAPDRERRDIVHHHAARLFTPERWRGAYTAFRSHEGIDRALGALVIDILETSGFYDDPRDKRRTVQNLQDCALAHVHRYPFLQHPVWHNDDYSLIGVEIGFQFVIESDITGPFRYVGRLDGLHWHDKELYVHDNKTASRLDEGWEQSFQTLHQLTGYCTAATLFSGVPVWRGIIEGLAIPLPRSIDAGGVMRVPFSRTSLHVGQWVTWACRQVDTIRTYVDKPLEAAMFTHACNRYFRPCAFIPLCSSPTEEEAQRTLNEMSIEPWDPLHTEDGNDANVTV